MPYFSTNPTFKVWLKKRTVDQKYTFIKKSTIFTQSCEFFNKAYFLFTVRFLTQTLKTTLKSLLIL